MFQVLNDRLGRDCKPYIIAELSANHGGSIERAKKSILAAGKAGASAVKIQTYTPDTMTLDCDRADFKVEGGLWDGRTLYDLYAEAYTPFEWHKELFEFASGHGITLFSSPFDETAVDLLEELGTPAYKIASFEMTDLPLIKYVAEKQKPVFISTGMSAIDEVAEAVETVKACGNNDILLFHCISSYPAPTEASQLHNIKVLEKEFGVLVGLSDHTQSNAAAIMSIALGGVAVEKHFKLDDEDCGPDSSFSLLPEELGRLVEACNEAWLAVGKEGFQRAKQEQGSIKFRRSIYFMKDLPAGAVIKEGDVRRIRPGYGLEPKYFDDVIGRTLSVPVQRGQPTAWECFASE